MAEARLLIGDIGGTNARFALADAKSGGFASETTLRCADFETAEDAIDHYLEGVGAARPAVICLAAAGPVVDQSVRLTNNPWTLDARELAERFGRARIRLLNDFEAIAWALPFLKGDDVMVIGLEDWAARDEQDYTAGVLGAGTGLGVGGVTVRAGRIHHIVGEGGHVGFAPENQLQLQVLRELRERHERVSDERLLSGPGIESIDWALRRIHGAHSLRLSAADVFERARSNEDVIAAEALQVFYEVLGQVAGNLALTLGAWDGIYIGGGIVKRYPDLLKTSRFRSGFENKGRHRSLMERVPTFLITHPQPGLLGASHCARLLQSRRTVLRTH